LVPPYLAGLFALCRQVDPDITLGEFWSAMYETGERCDFEEGGFAMAGSVVQPTALIARIQRTGAHE